MVVVSQNDDLYINLNGPIDCKLLCKKIGKFIDNYNKNFGIKNDRTLVLSIKTSTHTIEHNEVVTIIKKLEKND